MAFESNNHYCNAHMNQKGPFFFSMLFNLHWPADGCASRNDNNR